MLNLPRFLRVSILVGLFALAIGPARAASFDETHDRLLADQYAGVTMELKLPKTRFYQGEIIPATLTFHSTATRPYQVWKGEYLNVGRMPDLGFRGEAENGTPVLDPVQHAPPGAADFDHGGAFIDLGQGEMTVTVNEWLRFDQPGTYRLYGWSTRVLPGTHDGLKKEVYHSSPPEVVSSIITVHIDPLAPAQERELLAQAAKNLATGQAEVWSVAVRCLRFLQTPSAREMLMPLVGETRDASQALAEALDPEAGGDRLVEAVAAHRVPISLAMLTEHLFPIVLPDNLGFVPARMARADELIEAATSSVRDYPWDGSSLADELALFLEERVDWHRIFVGMVSEPRTSRANPQRRETLVRRQLELSDAQGEQVIGIGLPVDERPRFLPLIRRLAHAPANSLAALPLLAELAPAEARQLVIDDILHPPLRHIGHSGGSSDYIDLKPLLCLPAGTVLPELDEALHQRFLHQDPDWSGENGIQTALDLAAHYGSAALLPDVIAAYQPHEGRWACRLEEAALRYWLRCAPPAGLAALKRALASRKETGCYKSVLMILSEQWSPEALPMVEEALDDESEEVCSSATWVLASHAASPPTTEKMLRTAERLSPHRSAAEKAGRYSISDTIVRMLLEKESWNLTRAQLERLRPLTEYRPESRAKIDRRLAR